MPGIHIHDKPLKDQPRGAYHNQVTKDTLQNEGGPKTGSTRKEGRRLMSMTGALGLIGD